MNEIAIGSFEGSDIRAQEINGRQLILCADLAEPLGFEDEDQVRRVINRNKGEILKSEVFRVKLTREQGSRSPWACTALGAHQLAMLAATEKGARFRVWTLTHLIKPYLDGARMITPEQFAALKTERDLYRTLAADALPVVQQQGAALEHLARAHNLGLEFASACLRAEKNAPGTKALRALKDALPLVDLMFPKPNVAKPAPEQKHERTLTEAILDAIEKAHPPLRRIQDVRKAVGQRSREVDREVKILFTVGRIGFAPDGSLVVRRLDAAADVLNTPAPAEASAT